MDPIYYGPNAAVIAELYSKFLADPSSVDDGWKTFFGDLEDDAKTLLTGMNGAAAPAAPAAATNGTMPDAVAASVITTAIALL